MHLFAQVVNHPLGRPGAHGHPRRIAGHDPSDDEDQYGETQYHEDGMDGPTNKESNETHLLLDDKHR